MVETLKAWPYCRNYSHDMKMINYAKSAVTRMLQLNNAFHMDHGTSKQIISKLSTVTLRDKLHDKLNELQYAEDDTHGVNNYIKAL